MKVLMICQSFPTLSETFVLAQVRGLDDVLTSIVAEHVDPDLIERFDVRQKVHCLEPRWPAPGIRHQPWLKVRLAMQRRKPGRLVGWPPDVQDRLVRVIRSERPDTVLIQYGHMAAWLYPALARSGVPYVIHFHGVDASATLADPDYCASLAVILPRAQGVIVANRRMRERLEKLAEGVRFAVFPCGAPVPREIATRPDSPGQCRLLAVGRLVGKKAPTKTIEAVALAQGRTSTRITLHLIGDGPLMAEVVESVRRHGLQDQVTIHGSRPNDFARQMMRTADLFVQHSVVAPDGDREGTSISVIEAGAEGLPVIATRHEGICESIVEGKTGFLVDEHDVQAMAERIALLVDDPELRRQMGLEAHAHAREFLNEERYLGQVRRVLGLDGVSCSI
jgi:colanic acid/amylovoran biosynthesis glycosyltransferase